LRLVWAFETAHPDLSERRSPLRCLSTVQRTESLHWTAPASAPHLAFSRRLGVESPAQLSLYCAPRQLPRGGRRFESPPELNQAGARPGSRIDCSISPDPPCFLTKARCRVARNSSAVLRLRVSCLAAVDALSHRLNSIRRVLGQDHGSIARSPLTHRAFLRRLGVESPATALLCCASASVASRRSTL
jgi:hypothetical protein